MGSSESKMAACAQVKPEPAIKNNRVNALVDPRSPSTGIDRTPIQVGYPSYCKLWGKGGICKVAEPLQIMFPRLVC